MPSSETVTLTLPRDYVGQMLDGLEVLIEQWDATAEYLTYGEFRGEPVIIRECSDAHEAEAIAAYYRQIATAVYEQMKKTNSGGEKA